VTPPLFLLDFLPVGDELLLSGDEGHHAARVKRMRAGEELLVSDGRGGLLHCRVTKVIADALHLAVLSRQQVQPPDPRLVVVQALAKGERAELAVETLTELGVDEIVPWAASRSITQWRGARGDKALQRWRRTAREASKQSRRAWIPDVAAAVDRAGAMARLRAATLALVLHEDADSPLTQIPLPTTGEIAIVVGPEGGITPEESDAFETAGAVLVRLGAPVLRTSTAGSAALAALSARLGRWG
jgi:16S rRNA (uracil1498-N3)-methyltransferase